MTTKLGLTKRQKEVFEWVKDYIASHDGQAPTYQEIADFFNCSTSAAAGVVKKIIQRGHLTHLPDATRSLAVVA